MILLIISILVIFHIISVISLKFDDSFIKVKGTTMKSLWSYSAEQPPKARPKPLPNWL